MYNSKHCGCNFHVLAGFTLSYQLIYYFLYARSLCVRFNVCNKRRNKQMLRAAIVKVIVYSFMSAHNNINYFGFKQFVTIAILLLLASRKASGAKFKLFTLIIILIDLQKMKNSCLHNFGKNVFFVCLMRALIT